MTWLGTLRRSAADERGASIVEYTVVSGLALPPPATPQPAALPLCRT